MFRVAGDYCFIRRGHRLKAAGFRVDSPNSFGAHCQMMTGFRVEGRARRDYPDGADAILFGMLEEECYWK